MGRTYFSPGTLRTLGKDQGRDVSIHLPTWVFSVAAGGRKIQQKGDLKLPAPFCLEETGIQVKPFPTHHSLVTVVFNNTIPAPTPASTVQIPLATRWSSTLVICLLRLPVPSGLFPSIRQQNTEQTGQNSIAVQPDTCLVAKELMVVKTFRKRHNLVLLEEGEGRV